MGGAKTYVLLAGLTALFVIVGYALGGQMGMYIALFAALAMNFFSYWNSDKLALKAHSAIPIEGHYPWLDEMLARLSSNAQIPTPRLYIMENAQPNAFATGRNPEKGAVALTTGIMELLNRDELEGVVAHELAHIKNRDTLMMTVTATFSGAISMLGRFGGMFGRGRGGRGAGIGIIAAILAPLAAMFVQMAISRTREYGADRVGAEISGKPLALASALEKISGVAPTVANYTAENNPASAHLFIFNPLNIGGLKKMFSTHPDPKKRIEKLIELSKTIGDNSNSANFNNDVWSK